MRFLYLLLRTSLGLFSYCRILDFYQLFVIVLVIRYLVVQCRGYTPDITSCETYRVIAHKGIGVALRYSADTSSI